MGDGEVIMVGTKRMGEKAKEGGKGVDGVGAGGGGCASCMIPPFSMAYHPPTPDQCAAALRPGVERKTWGRSWEEIAENNVLVLQEQLRVASFLVGVEVDAVRRDTQSLLDRLPEIEGMDAWDRCSFLQGSFNRLFSELEKWQGLAHLFDGYKEASPTRETAVWKARVVLMAANNKVVLDGGEYGGEVFIGLAGRKAVKQLEVRRRADGILEELTGNDNITDERLTHIHQELDTLFGEMSPTVGITR